VAQKFTEKKREGKREEGDRTFLYLGRRGRKREGASPPSAKMGEPFHRIKVSIICKEGKEKGGDESRGQPIWKGKVLLLKRKKEVHFP